jgi:hypothetical protein
VEVSITPEPEDEERDALLAALRRTGLRDEGEPPAYRSPWRIAALQDAARP